MKPWYHTPLAILAVFTTLTLGACASTRDDSGAPPALASGARWAVLPFVNATETPLAAQRAQVLAQSLLGARGVADVQLYPKTPRDTLFGPEGEADAPADALQWARQQGLTYALAGEVFEWRYKVGVDGEPAVGLSLRVIDVATGKTLWSGSRSRSGWSRESLGMVAQDTLRALIASATARRAP